MSDESARPSLGAPGPLIRLGRFLLSVAIAMAIVGIGLILAAGVYLVMPIRKTDIIDGFYLGAVMGMAILAAVVPLLFIGLFFQIAGGGWRVDTSSDQQPPPSGEPIANTDP